MAKTIQFLLPEFHLYLCLFMLWKRIRTNNVRKAETQNVLYLMTAYAAKFSRGYFKTHKSICFYKFPFNIEETFTFIRVLRRAHKEFV